MAYQNDRIKQIPAPLPVDYDRQTNFTDYQTANPGQPMQGAALDAEFNVIEQALDETQARQRLIQRDDGALQNGIVSRDSLAEEVIAGVNSPTTWTVSTVYAETDSVIVYNEPGQVDPAWYVCEVGHTAVDFAADLAAGRWRLLVDLGTLLADAGQTVVVSGSGSETFTDALNGRPIVFDSEAGMIAQTALIEGLTVVTLGKTAPGDGEGQTFKIVESGGDVTLANGNEARIVSKAKTSTGTQTLATALDDRVVRVGSVAGLANVTPAEGLQFSVGEFWPGTGIGGGLFEYNAERSKTEHNGVTVIDPGKLAQLGAVGEFGTYFTAAGSGTGVFEREESEILASFAGAVPSLTDDYTVSAQAALAVRNRVWFGPGNWVVNGLELSDSSQVYAIRSNGDVDNGAWLIGTEPGGILTFTDRCRRPDINGVNFDASVNGVEAISQALSSFATINYMDNGNFSNSYISRGVTVGLRANLLGHDSERVFFQQVLGPTEFEATNRYHIIALGYPDDTETLQAEVNINTFRKCNLYNGLPADGEAAIQARRGRSLVFDGCIGEALRNPLGYFMDLEGVGSTYWVNGWLELGSSENEFDHVVVLRTDGSGSPQTSNLYIQDSTVHLTGCQVSIVDIPAGGTTYWSGNTFTGNGDSNYATRKGGVLGDGWETNEDNIYGVTLAETLFGTRTSPRFFKSLRSIRATDDMSFGDIANGTDQIFIRKTDLEDAPASPQEVASFTVPEGGAETRMQAAVFNGFLTVTAVDDSLTAKRRMAIPVTLLMARYGSDTATADLQLGTILNSNGGPSVTASVSGGTVTLLFEHDPTGGTFSAGGIVSVLTGTLHQAGGSVSDPDRVVWQ